MLDVVPENLQSELTRGVADTALYSSLCHPLKPVPEQQICKYSSFPEHNMIPRAISGRCKYNLIRGLDYRREEDWSRVETC